MMAVVGLVLIDVTVIVWTSERSFGSAWAIERVDAGLVCRKPSEREMLLAGCERPAGVHGLADREVEVLSLLVGGHTYQEVCSGLLLSPNTVKTHARHAYGKLGVHTREEATSSAREEGRRACGL